VRRRSARSSPDSRHLREPELGILVSAKDVAEVGDARTMGRLDRPEDESRPPADRRGTAEALEGLAQWPDGKNNQMSVLISPTSSSIEAAINRGY
jgi:hypothetical protein